MTTNMIACIAVLSAGIIIGLLACYSLYLAIKEGEVGYGAASLILFVGSLLLIVVPLVHWHDDDEYKRIECREYKVETLITTSSKGQVDTTYVIQYKSK